MAQSGYGEFRRTIYDLVDAGCDVVLIGGVAIQLHGGDHVTKDIDFAYLRTRANAEKIAAALAPHHPVPASWPEGVPFVWDGQALFSTTVVTLETDLGRIDLLGAPDGAPPYQALKAHSTPILLDGRTVHVASIDDLISMKRAAGRPKDLAHVAELESIKHLIEEEGLGP